eukprot:jgi/Hompol1/414/HPOL_002987-RA
MWVAATAVLFCILQSNPGKLHLHNPSDSLIPSLQESLPRLKLVADFGLVLFLFLVGLELDPTKLATQFKRSAAISLIGIALPFGLGIGISRLIYDTLADKAAVTFTSFFVFCGVAMSITAFPVLARILTERKLIRTEVGQITLAAAATDDAMAWTLLVLVVALINNPASTITALYVFLAVIAWATFLWFAVRPVLLYVVKQSESRETASQQAVLAVFVSICISAWFTQAVGVHSIFGAFLVGIITPHYNGFAVKIAEKVEDLISILFIPIYFTFAGLSFSIDSLNDGMSWLITLLVIVVACGGKIIGCTTAARVSGLPWRESFTVGFLMNTKGLVELIVLNLGLQAGVINIKIFTIFVIMALITTFMTVPLVSLIYPMSLYHESAVQFERRTHRHGDEEDKDAMAPESIGKTSEVKTAPTVLLCLRNMKTAAGMLALTQLISKSAPGVQLYALRLMGLSDRFSKLMMANDTPQTLRRDLLINMFRTFGQLNSIVTKLLLSVSVESEFAENVIECAKDANVDFLIFPIEGNTGAYPNGIATLTIEDLFQRSPCTTVLYVDRGFGGGFEEFSMDDLYAEPTRETEGHPKSVSTHRSGASALSDGRSALASLQGNERTKNLVFSFFGGQDDCEAASVISWLAKGNPDFHVTVFSIVVTDRSTVATIDIDTETVRDRTGSNVP